MSLTADGYRLGLTDGVEYLLAPGSRTALIPASAGADAAVTTAGAETAGPSIAALMAELAREAAARGTAAALILADGAQPLHAALSVGDQIAAALGGTRRAAVDRATDLLEAAGVPEPHERVEARPHELSALDRQRVQLALALANLPALLLAEDPADGLSPVETPAFAAALARLHARLGFTLVVSAAEQSRATRLVDEILVLEDGRILDRLRRQP